MDLKIEYEKALLKAKISYIEKFKKEPNKEFDYIFSLGWKANEFLENIEGE